MQSAVANDYGVIGGGIQVAEEKAKLEAESRQDIMAPSSRRTKIEGLYRHTHAETHTYTPRILTGD